jgi:hypothetical protein
MLHRRSLLIGLAASITAPAICRAASLMPVRVMVPAPPDLIIRPTNKTFPWGRISEYRRDAEGRWWRTVIDCSNGGDPKLWPVISRTVITTQMRDVPFPVQQEVKNENHLWT